MEIVTYVVHGGLYHKDSMGTKETLGRGAIQFMTAGTGVRHEEYNHEDSPLRFIQTWIVPRSRGLKPNYGSSRGSLAEGGPAGGSRKNQFQHLVSDVQNGDVSTPVKINQDVDMFASELDLGKKIKMELPEGRMAYLLCVEGGITVNGHQQLTKHDGCEITGGKGGTLEIEATDVEATATGDVAHVLVFSMDAEEGAGRSDF